MIALKKSVPRIHYYNQDFMDVYIRTWNMVDDCWEKGPSIEEGALWQPGYFHGKKTEELLATEACFTSFYLVYSNKIYNATGAVDNFYMRQESSGAIRYGYDKATGQALVDADNPHGLCPPLFAWVEYDLYHKIGQKKRVKEIVPILCNYFHWLDEVAFDESVGLYHTPLAATMMGDCLARAESHYLIDFNCQQALSAFYIAQLADILNDKELAFRFKKRYFMLKTKINSLMWDDESGFYYDLDKDGKQVLKKTIAGYWPMLAELPNEDRCELLVAHLGNEETFGSYNPFPTVAMNEPLFDPLGNGHNGGVYPELTYMIIKGLEKYGRYELAREATARHLYCILDRLHPESGQRGCFWDCYCAQSDAVGTVGEGRQQDKDYVGMVALVTITLMIENIVGLRISLPRKTVDWVVPMLELMGVENLSLKRNVISILSLKNHRNNWEIRLESDKLYYFTVDLIGVKKKTLPIPSGRCSMLLDKL